MSDSTMEMSRLRGLLVVMGSVTFWTSSGAVTDPLCQRISLESAAQSGEITNPSYPNSLSLHDYYGESVEICWIIHMPPKIYRYHFIQVELHDLDLHIPGDCSSTTDDYVEFREGSSAMSPVVGKWCSGWEKPGYTLTSCTEDLAIRLYASKRSIGYAGLNVTYSLINRELYDCEARGPVREADVKVDVQDGAIAGVAFFLLVAVFIIAIIIVCKTRQGRPNNPDPRQRLPDNAFQRPAHHRNSSVSAGFQHQRFENEPDMDADQLDASHGSLSGYFLQRSSLSDSMRSAKPLPIGIPRGTYRADGFPAAYACNIPDVSARDLQVGVVCHSPANGKLPQQSGSSSLAVSGLPAERPTPASVDAKPPLEAAVEAEVEGGDLLVSGSLPTDTSAAQFGQALERRLADEGNQLARSVPEGNAARQEDIMLSFSSGEHYKNESFA